MKNPTFANVMLDSVVEQIRPSLLLTVRVNNVVQWLMILPVIAGIPVFIYLFGWLGGIVANIALFIGSVILVVILNRVDFALCQSAMAKVAREQTEKIRQIDEYFKNKYGDLNEEFDDEQ
jgi:hypothetical protein